MSHDLHIAVFKKNARKRDLAYVIVAWLSTQCLVPLVEPLVSFERCGVRGSRRTLDADAPRDTLSLWRVSYVYRTAVALVTQAETTFLYMLSCAYFLCALIRWSNKTKSNMTTDRHKQAARHCRTRQQYIDAGSTHRTAPAGTRR